VLSQSNRNFVWLIFLHKNTELVHVENLRKAINNKPNIVLVLCNQKNHNPHWKVQFASLREQISRFVPNSVRHVITTNLDSDDALSQNYTEAVQECFHTQTEFKYPYIIDAAGCHYFEPWQSLYSFRHMSATRKRYSSVCSSLAEETGDDLKTIFIDEHYAVAARTNGRIHVNTSVLHVSHLDTIQSKYRLASLQKRAKNSNKAAKFYSGFANLGQYEHDILLQSFPSLDKKMKQYGFRIQHQFNHFQMRAYVYHKLKLIWFPTTRCACTSIQRNLRQALNERPIVYRLKTRNGQILDSKTDNIVPNFFADYMKFTFVRNPWDRLLSTYIYITEYNKKLRQKTIGERNLSFRNFVKMIKFRTLVAFNEYIYPQYLLLPNGQELDLELDFVGRFEHLEQDWGIIQKRFHLPRLGHIRRTSHDHYSRYYDETTRNYAADYYCLDIQKFEYAFEDHGIPSKLF
jgi:hypothetical protein